MSYLFFSKDNIPQESEKTLDRSFERILWKPTIRNIRPPGSPFFPYLVWWLFHHFHIFSNGDYCVFCIVADNKIIHRTLVTPRYFRFPFMDKQDLQLGDIWTDPQLRGEGIASYAISQIHKIYSQQQNIKFWYVTNEKNKSSIKLARKAGFSLSGKGVRYSKCGLRVFGQYNFP